MPMPFERLRLLNGSSKNITNVTYAGSPISGVQATGSLLPPQQVPDAPRRHS